MSWAFIAITERVRRRLVLLALVASAIALSLVIYAFGHPQTRAELCNPPFEEVAETWLMNHPECLDGGMP